MSYPMIANQFELSRRQSEDLSRWKIALAFTVHNGNSWIAFAIHGRESHQETA